MYFFSVISFPLTFKWPKEEVDFFPLIFLIAFQTVFGLVFDVREEQKLFHDVFFWVFFIIFGFGFQLLKSKYIFCRRVSKKFPLSFLPFFNSLFTNIVKPRYFREFIFRSVGFGNSLVCNLNQSICKLSHWILRQGQLARQPRHTQSAEGQSALSNFQCLAAGLSSLGEVFRMTGKWSLPPVKFQCKRWITDWYIRNRKGVMTVVSVCRFTSV